MAEIERKEVIVSEQFDHDIASVYAYGEDIFGTIAARSFIADIFSRIWSLDNMYLLQGLQGQYMLDTRNIANGMYLYTVTCGKATKTGKLIISK